MNRLIDALFNLCLSRQQREKHRRNLKEKDSQQNSPISSRSSSKHSSPAQSRASSPPRRSYAPPPTPSSPTVRSRDTSPYRLSGSPTHPYAVLPRVIHPRQTRIPICYDDIVQRSEEQKQAKRKSLEAPSPPPLVYPIPPKLPLQGVGKYRRSIHVSETFIESNCRDELEALQVRIKPVGGFVSGYSREGFEERVEREPPHMHRIQTSTDSFALPESMTSASTSSPLSTVPTVSSVLDTAKRPPVRRASEGTMPTTSPLSAFHNLSSYQESIQQQSLKPLPLGEGEIVERDGKLVILVHNPEPFVPAPSPPAPGTTCRSRGFRLPPIPDNQEFESDTESEDGGVAIVEGVEEVETFTSKTTYLEGMRRSETRTNYSAMKGGQRRRVRGMRRQATHPGAFNAQRKEMVVEQRCGGQVRRVVGGKRKVRANSE